MAGEGKGVKSLDLSEENVGYGERNCRARKFMLMGSSPCPDIPGKSPAYLPSSFFIRGLGFLLGRYL